MNRIDEFISEQLQRPKVEIHDHPTMLRCEATRSRGYDPTGENAEPCGLHAWLFCENCQQYLCDYDAEQFCSAFPFVHKLIPAKEVAHA